MDDKTKNAQYEKDGQGSDREAVTSRKRRNKD